MPLYFASTLLATIVIFSIILFLVVCFESSGCEPPTSYLYVDVVDDVFDEGGWGKLLSNMQ